MTIDNLYAYKFCNVQPNNKLSQGDTTKIEQVGSTETTNANVSLTRLQEINNRLQEIEELLTNIESRLSFLYSMLQKIKDIGFLSIYEKTQIAELETRISQYQSQKYALETERAELLKEKENLEKNNDTRASQTQDDVTTIIKDPPKVKDNLQSVKLTTQLGKYLEVEKFTQATSTVTVKKKL